MVLRDWLEYYFDFYDGDSLVIGLSVVVATAMIVVVVVVVVVERVVVVSVSW